MRLQHFRSRGILSLIFRQNPLFFLSVPVSLANFCHEEN